MKIVVEKQELKGYEKELVGKILFHEVEKVIYIDSVFVEEMYRNRGYASKLMQEFINWIDQNGYECVPICGYAQKWLKEYQKKK